MCVDTIKKVLYSANARQNITKLYISPNDLSTLRFVLEWGMNKDATYITLQDKPLCSSDINNTDILFDDKYKVVAINFSLGKLSTDDIRKLISFINKSTLIKYIDLSKITLDEDSIQILYETVKTHVSLSEILVYGNRLLSK